MQAQDKTNPEIFQWTLPNGLRLVHRYADSPVSHFGLFINTGSRDETDEENGLAHFIEHVIFKGTKKRKGFHILNRIETVGGELNAFTTKEITAIYSTFLSQHYPRAVELIADIAFHSVFPEKELEKEKEVIIDEINSYRDNPYELIYDEFEEMIFRGHPLSRNILGEPERIRLFSRDDVIRFISENYLSNRMVLCSVGKMSPGRFFRMVEQYFTSIPERIAFRERLSFIPQGPLSETRSRNTHQTHCMLGAPSFSRSDPRKTTLMLLNNILGGPGLNSRLSLLVREKHGYSYNIESMYQSYSDTGLWCVYMGTTNGSADKTLGLVIKELKKLRDQSLGTLQLSRAKMQLTGQIAIHFEANQSKMLSLGKSLLMDNRVDTLDSFNCKIGKITAKDILEVANIVFDEKNLSYLTYSSTE